MLVSFVIPSFNSSEFICRTFDSIINQTCNDYEVIIVDDYSSDNTCSLIEEYILKNNLEGKFKLIKLDSNMGVSNARNIGMSNSIGKYILFLDCDDVVENNLVKVVKENDNDFDLIIYSYDYGYYNGKILRTNTNEQSMIKGFDAIKKYYRGKLYICTGNTLYKNSFLKNNSLEYPVDCTNGEDQEFFIMCLYMAGYVKVLENIMFHWIKRKGSVTHSFDVKKFDIIFTVMRIIKKFEYDSKCFNLIKYLKNEYLLESFIGNINIGIRIEYFENKKILNYAKNIWGKLEGTKYRKFYDENLRHLVGYSKYGILNYIFQKSKWLYSIIVILDFKLRGEINEE